MIRIRAAGWFFSILFFSAPLLAADKKEVPPSPWAGSSVSLGDVNSTTGKKSSITLALDGKLNYLQGRWKELGEAGFHYGKTNDVLSKEQYSAQDQVQYSFNQNAKIDNYGYVKASFLQDSFAAYQRQIVAMLGYGRDWIKGKKYQLTTQFGPAFRQMKNQGPDAIVSSHVAIQFSLTMGWHVTQSVELSESVNYTLGQPSDYIKSTSSITSSLTSALALSANYTIEHYSSPPKGLASSSTNSSVSLIYQF